MPVSVLNRRGHRTRPRFKDETCDYCYQSRIFLVDEMTNTFSDKYKTFEKKAQELELECTCADGSSMCRDPLCLAYVG